MRCSGCFSACWFLYVVLMKGPNVSWNVWDKLGKIGQGNASERLLLLTWWVLAAPSQVAWTESGHATTLPTKTSKTAKARSAQWLMPKVSLSISKSLPHEARMRPAACKGLHPHILQSIRPNCSNNFRHEHWNYQPAGNSRPSTYSRHLGTWSPCEIWRVAMAILMTIPLVFSQGLIGFLAMVPI